MWKSFEIDGYYVEAKVYDVGSQFGISGGRISKLIVIDQNNNWVINYDRGWDVKPTAAHMGLLGKIVRKFS